MTALRFSCLIHVFLLLVLSDCAPCKPPGKVLGEAAVREARDFVAAVAVKMPLWDTDSTAPYERVAIAAVKADIATAQLERRGLFLQDVAKLHEDWEALVSLDEMLRKEWLV